MVRKRGTNGRRVSKDSVLSKNWFFGKRYGVHEGVSKVVEHANFFGVNSKLPEYITLMSKDDLGDFIDYEKPYTLLDDAVELICYPKTNAHAYIKALRELVYRLGQMVMLDKMIIKKYQQEEDRTGAKYGERSGKRWTPQEDELLIERATDDGVNVIDLSREFGRTAGAITSRITYLVGIERLSSKVAGRFIGLVDGEQVEVDLNGTVYKEHRKS